MVHFKTRVSPLLHRALCLRRTVRDYAWAWTKGLWQPHPSNAIKAHKALQLQSRPTSTTRPHWTMTESTFSKRMRMRMGACDPVHVSQGSCGMRLEDLTVTGPSNVTAQLPWSHAAEIPLNYTQVSKLQTCCQQTLTPHLPRHPERC